MFHNASNYHIKLRPLLVCLFILIAISGEARGLPTDTLPPIIQFVYSSDAHYGITRHQFDGDSNVNAQIVNARMIAKINSLPRTILPQDGGVNAGLPVGAVDYFLQSGDIANRQEIPIQSATVSWAQFTHGYMDGLTLKDRSGKPITLLIVPGNHDVSDAIGFYKKMQPLTDPASMVGIYNQMLRPAIPKTATSFHYPADKINYSRDIGGIHFLFLTIWPDSANRIWMEKDLGSVSAGTPVIIVAHDPPEGDGAHFTNPNGAHDINPKDRFENLLEEWSKDRQDYPAASANAKDNQANMATTSTTTRLTPASLTQPAPIATGQTQTAQAQPAPDAKPQNDRAEQLGFVTFVKAHPNIKAYFHGHNNWNQFYMYTGPDHDIALPTFRVDSPMKGKYSSKDETKLSFQVISINTASKTMTVRECLWNTNPAQPDNPVSWGETITISLQ
jgi:Calcineurin-like phosphoesterase